MGDSPVSALRKKKDSRSVSASTFKEKEAAAAVSAGIQAPWCRHTPSRDAARIKRPGIAITTPTLHGVSVTVDVGANLNPSAYELFQYAIMADVFAKKRPQEKTSLDRITQYGEEESKGTEVIKETYKLLANPHLIYREYRRP